MIEVEKFQPYHIDVLIAQGVQLGQLGEVSHVPANYSSVARISGPAMTARVGGVILLCGGVLPVGPKIGELWGLLSQQAGAHFLALHRATLRFIDIDPPRRLQASVEKGFGQGCRWLEMLGFHFEGEMEAYGFDGETHLRYAKVKR